MKSLLIQKLETICPNKVYLQGTLEENAEYPDSFITFWTDITDDNAFYNDEVHSVDWHFSVIYYTNNPANITTVPTQIRNALIQAGFIAVGKGNDIPSDRPSHTGWAMDFIYTEYQTND